MVNRFSKIKWIIVLVAALFCSSAMASFRECCEKKMYSTIRTILQHKKATQEEINAEYVQALQNGDKHLIGILRPHQTLTNQLSALILQLLSGNAS